MQNTLHERASGAATETHNSGDFSAGNSRTVDLTIDIESVSATDSVVFELQRKGEDGNYTALWTSDSQTDAATLTLTVAVLGARDQGLPTILRLVATITVVSISPSVTYSSSVVGNA